MTVLVDDILLERELVIKSVKFYFGDTGYRYAMVRTEDTVGVAL